MTDKNNFFNKEENRLILAKAKEKIDSLSPASSTFEKARNQHISNIIEAMVIDKQPTWDKHCQINIKLNGEELISKAKTLADGKKISSKNELDDVYSICFQFLFELYLSMKTKIPRSQPPVGNACFDALRHTIPQYITKPD